MQKFEINPAELKAELRATRHGPANCAIGVESSSDVGIMLSKRGTPIALRSAIRKQYGNIHRVYWGTAQVSMEDTSTVVFTLNKTFPSLAKFLTRALKGTGYTKAQIELSADADNEVEADMPG